MKTIGIAAAWWFMSWQVAAAVSPTADELAKSRAWAAARFETGAEPFFSFTYGGKSSAEFLKSWDVKRASRPLDDRRTEHTVVYAEPKVSLRFGTSSDTSPTGMSCVAAT